MSKRILCLHAHPDDAEFLVGGTLALLARAGHQVTIVSMTSGDCGSDIYGPEEISRIRNEEGKAAAALIGAEYQSLGFKDLAIFIDDDSRRKVTAALRRFRPDIVLTASPADYHCDHEATSKLVTDACFACSAPNYSTAEFDAAPALPAIPHMYYVDPAEGTDREGNVIRPDFMVNVAETFAVKREMLSKHDSQRAWLQRQHGMDDFLATIEDWCKARAALAGLTYAEGFRQYVGHPWPRTALLEELVGEALITRLKPAPAAG